MRAQMVLDNLKFIPAGADVHLIENMRHTASLLIQALERCSLTEEIATLTLKSLEEKELKFFKNRFDPK